MRRRGGLIFIAAAWIACLAAAFPVAAQAPPQPAGLSVLVISSFHQNLPFAERVAKGLEQALAPSTGRNSVYFEYLDASRFDIADYGAPFARTLAAKFQHKKLDAVVVWGAAAAKFIDAYWDVLQPARIVGGELTSAMFAPLAAKGVPASNISPVDNYEASLRVMIDTVAPRRVALAGEAMGESGRQRLQGLLAGWRHTPAEITLENLFDLPLDQIVERVKNLPTGGAVYYTPIFHDEHGRNIRPTDALKRIAAVSPVPVFSQWETFIGDAGAVGGWVLSGEALGRVAGLTASALAAGDAGAAATAAAAPPYLMLFDAAQMRRWGVAESRLPAGAVQLNRTPGVWDQHREFVIAAFSVVMVMALFSVFLLRSLEARRLLVAELAAERESLARKVTERTADLDVKAVELSRSNAELESFAYAVSHDLRAPLRTVRSYVGLLVNSAKDKLDDEEREFADFVRSGAERLDGMIHGLLEYSRAGRATAGDKTADLRQAAEDAAAAFDLPRSAPDAELRLEIPGDLPPVVADQNGVERLIQNLIDNALKYRRPDRPPAVRVSAAVVNDEVVLTVADNGVGIPENQQERVFGLFQRLQTKQEGFGVGLALCRRIMDACGGRLWVESAAGQGCAFHAAFPRGDKV
jgi:signal transduction histidine kinase